MGLSEGTTLNHDRSRGIGKCCATRHDPIAPTVDSGTGRGQKYESPTIRPIVCKLHGSS
jgi:hypothetical protein